MLELKELFCRLWNALNGLPEIQGRRVDAHFILGMTYREIAQAEGVEKARCGTDKIYESRKVVSP